LFDFRNSIDERDGALRVVHVRAGVLNRQRQAVGVGD
jgi:hypothetical protein